MTDSVEVALIGAVGSLISIALNGYIARQVSRSRTRLGAVEKKMDGLLDQRVKAAGDIGELKGHATGMIAGAKEERDRI